MMKSIFYIIICYITFISAGPRVRPPGGTEGGPPSSRQAAYELCFYSTAQEHIQLQRVSV